MKVARRILFLITLAVPLLLPARNHSEEKATKINKIVIDPGHGGREPGCVYNNVLEKDINLSIALKLGELIRKNLSDVEVIFTRTTDKQVGLAERAAIANRAKADLFLSVHINALESSAVNGTSTYIMGVDNSAQNLAVAMRENDVIIYEEDYTTKYEGFTPGDPTSYIMFSLMQSANRDQSMRFAEIIQKHFSHDLPMKDLGARQGSLLVLHQASMPAVLTEVGFLSNERDRKYISTNKGQSEAARSLFNAFSEYKSKTEGRSSVILLKEKTSLPDITAQLTPEQKAQVEAARSNSSQTSSKPAANAGASQPTAAKPAGQSADASHNIRFYVQVASLGKPKDVGSADFKSYRGKVVQKKTPDGGYKYLVGGYPGYEEAVRQLNVVRREFKDAFIVAFEGNAQLKLDDARRKAGR